MGGPLQSSLTHTFPVHSQDLQPPLVAYGQVLGNCLNGDHGLEIVGLGLHFQDVARLPLASTPAESVLCVAT